MNGPIVIVNQGSVLDPWPLVQEVHPTINTIPEPDPALKTMTIAIIPAIMEATAGSNTGAGYPPGVECIVGLAMTAMKASMVAEAITAAGYPAGLCEASAMKMEKAFFWKKCFSS